MHVMVQAALGYVGREPKDRAASDEAGWGAVRRIVAQDLPEPEWELAPGGGRMDEKLQRAHLASTLGEITTMIAFYVSGTRDAWAHAAQPEVRRRLAMEGGRDVMRVLMRAWKEVADGVQAGAAKWEGRWAQARAGAGGCELGSRLKFNEGGSAWKAEEGWGPRMVLAWMRLVRAGKVRNERREGAKRRAAEAGAGTASKEAYLRHTPVYHEQQGAHPQQKDIYSGCREINWAKEAMVAADTGATSGASAVIARRQATGGGPAAVAHVAPTTDEKHTTRRSGGGDRSLIFTNGAWRIFSRQVSQEPSRRKKKEKQVHAPRENLPVQEQAVTSMHDAAPGTAGPSTEQAPCMETAEQMDETMDSGSHSERTHREQQEATVRAKRGAYEGNQVDAGKRHKKGEG